MILICLIFDDNDDDDVVAAAADDDDADGEFNALNHVIAADDVLDDSGDADTGVTDTGG